MLGGIDLVHDGRPRSAGDAGARGKREGQPADLAADVGAGEGLVLRGCTALATMARAEQGCNGSKA